MWLKTVESNYLNMLTGNRLCVEPDLPQEGNFAVVTRGPYGKHGKLVLQRGYKSQEDAQDALDGLMDNSENEVLELDPPDYVDSEEENADEDVVMDNYNNMTNDQLRQLLSERELSTSGSKNDLIARLRESDVMAEEE